MYKWPEVAVGQYVAQGQKLGGQGTTGGSTGVHLHFGISYNGTYVNPADYVKLK
jgi:murein DD-endopeptidase MepM/ murein hydrolase activator NlpD